MIKLIVSDMDGTMLFPKAQQLEPEILELIEKLLDAGYMIVAASGRQYANLYRLFRHLADRLIYICENGSLVVRGGQILYKSVIPQELRQRLVSEVMSQGTAELLFSTTECSYIQPKDEYFYNLVVNRVKNNAKVVEDLCAVEEECIKLSVYQKNEVSAEEEAYWINQYGKELYVVRSDKKWIDFMAKGTGKGKALQMILEQEQISPEECMIFGDSDNDVDMMALTANSYGMRTGTPALKNAVKNLVDRPEEILQKLV